MDGVRLEVPPGAVKSRVTIGITRLAETRSLADGMTNVTACATAYRFEPHGLLFLQPVRVTISFDRSLLGSPIALSNLSTCFFDETQGRWERLERQSIDMDNATITSITRHFTEMVNVTLTLPEGPSPLRFDVSSIKDLQAANPASGVPMPEGLEPGPFGSAAFAIRLRIPPGRGNATPDLALRYNSDLPNSWAGKGFDIDVPAITVDTRFGLPRYDGKDTYFLNGEELVPWGTDGSSLRFRPKREKNFQRLRWYRSEVEDYWEVTDKNGDVREYGRGEAWVGPNRSDRSRAYAWYLSKMEDAFGNTVVYNYFHDQPNMFTYLSEIRYSGFTGTSPEEGAYRILFKLSDNEREDRRIDCRGEFPSKLAKLLSRIDVFFRNEPIRSYVLEYQPAELGQSLLASFTENDAANVPFYHYTFTYYSLPEHRENGVWVGYDAFGDVEQKWAVDTPLSSTGLQGRSTSTVGGSLYTGLELSFWLPFVGKIRIASFGIRGGLDFSTGFMRGSFLDINGDGLPDAVGVQGNSLVGVLNTGSGFGESFSMTVPPELSGWRMDEESGGTRSMGLSASLMPASASVTKQSTDCTAETGFADINGDGLIDLIARGRPFFALNTLNRGNTFVPAAWSFGPPAEPIPPAADPNEDEYQKFYFLQQPLRKWKAYRSGSIEVSHTASLFSPDSVRDEGVALLTHFKDSTSALRLTGADPSVSSLSVHYAVAADDQIYFQMDTGRNEIGKDTNWNVRISYTGIDFFEAMARSAAFKPPATSHGQLPFNDAILASIYSGPDSHGTYSLKPAWWSQDAGILLPVYQSLISNAAFVPRQLTRSQFVRLLGAVGSDFVERMPNPDPKNSDPIDIHTDDKLLSSYLYVPETSMFYWKSSDADSFILLHLAGAFPDREELREIASYRWLDHTLVIPRPEGTGYSYTETTAPGAALPAEILFDADSAVPGSVVSGKGILLDRTWTAEGEPLPLETFWLRADANTQWHIYRENRYGEQEDAEAGLSVNNRSGGMAIQFVDRGVERLVDLSEGTSLIEKIPDAILAGPVTDYVLRNEIFSAYGISRIPAAAWPQILAHLSANDGTFLSSCYALQDGQYRLHESVSRDDFVRALQILDTVVDSQNTAFDIFPGDTQGAKRFIALTAGEYIGIISIAGPGLAGCFGSYGADGSTFYYQRPDLTDNERTQLHSAMKRFRCDRDLFDFYVLDPATSTRVLKPGLDPAHRKIVTDTLSACGIVAWARIVRSFTYRSGSALPVIRGSLPDGKFEESFCPQGTEQLQSGRDTGVVSIPMIGDGGRTVLREKYIHVFDSAQDYSPKNLVDNSEESGKYHSEEVFRGGVFGWFYGAWVGYYPWNEADLAPRSAASMSAAPAQGDGALSSGLNVALPPHFLSMTPNTEAGKEPIIAREGLEPGIDVQTDAWVGPVNSYSKPAMDETGRSITADYHFAAFICDDMLHPRRNGGDAYHQIQRGTSLGSSGALGVFRVSSGDATDTNGGVSLGGFGLSGGANVGQSWQYQGLMDINGDRYPDLIGFSPSEAGGVSFSVTPGNGQGFDSATQYTSPFSHLAMYKNYVLAFGASTSSTSGGTYTGLNYYGMPTNTTVREPSKSLSGGMNGTAGSSFQSEGFLDINGDGLPDHVQRDGSGGYAVALNSGTQGFIGPASWGSGIVVPLFSGLAGLPATTSGLMHAGNGSFGLSLALGFDAGIIGAGLSVGYTGTVNQTWSSLEDMNGDGSPDLVVKLKNDDFFRVRFNMGDHFSVEETRLYRPDWDFSTEEALRGAISRDLATIAGLLGGLSLPAGLGVPGFSGLPDSQSNPFQSAVDPLSVSDVLDFTSGVCFNLGATLTFTTPTPLIALTISAGVNGSVATTSVTLKLMDINGDGMPDHVMKMPREGFLRVKLNALGKLGLLKSIHLPQGGKFDLEYVKAGNTVDMPHGRWALSRVTRDDGLADTVLDRGEHRYSESYAYSGGYYDRKEREFWGFSQVETLRADGSRVRVSYLNNNHYTRGMEWKRQVLGDDRGGSVSALWSETVLQVQEMGDPGSKVRFPAVTAATDRLYQQGTDRCVETRKSYSYDKDDGNLKTFFDEGSTAALGDELFAQFSYAVLPGYLKQHPEKITVEDGAGTLLRQRRGAYGSKGELLALSHNETQTSAHTWELGWDRYGNLEHIRDPRSCTTSWEYDAVVHRYVTRTMSGNPTFGGPQYESRAAWDYRWGRETERQDITRERMAYVYDQSGRLVEVRSPYDIGDTPAVRYRYREPGSSSWSARTWNKVSFDPSNSHTLETVLAIDGLGRIVQTAKQGEVWENGQRRRGWNLSGAVAYDGRGRTVAEGQPMFAVEEMPSLATMKKPTQKSYDVLDRITSILLPDGAVTSVLYAVRDGQHVELTRDPKGNTTERVLDARGNNVSVQRLDSADHVLTGARYSYTMMGELREAIDLAGNAIKSSYDLMGRRVRFESPDAGIVEYGYDGSGNLVRKVDSVRRARGGAVEYRYDGLNRLIQTDYPKSTAVNYTWGGPGAANHGAGRIVQRTDESGTVSYRYGKLGEGTGIDRRLHRVTPLANDENASLSYLLDYLGRMQQIHFPDGEVVTYGYDYGGQVQTVTGEHYGRTTAYVADVGYDEYGQRIYIKYGNGVETRCSYNENRRWLDAIHTVSDSGNVYQQMDYVFDEVGNVLGVGNASQSYHTAVSFSYDALYQLTAVSGTISMQSKGMTEYTGSYRQQFSFDEIGNMTLKQSSQTANPLKNVGAALDYSLEHAYYAGKAHQAERIGQLWYRYDANGNAVEERQGGHSESSAGEAELQKIGDLRVVNRGFGLTRRSAQDTGAYARYFVWDEENRLKRSVQGTESVDYRYGADGNRSVKYSSTGESLYFDAMWQESTDYPSFRRSKHLYLGQTRIATRCNIEGRLDVGYEELNTFYYHADHLGSAQLVTDSKGEVYEHMEYTPYGELWIEQTKDSAEKIPFRFTGKELDSETGLYYYGARYMDPKTSRWLSADPAMEDYLPSAPTSDAARRLNEALPGMGGIFNTVNMAVYTYAANNPVKYVDPTGKELRRFTSEYVMNDGSWASTNLGNDAMIKVGEQGCAVALSANAINTMAGNSDVTPGVINDDKDLFVAGSAGLYWDKTAAKYDIGFSLYRGDDLASKLKQLDRAGTDYAVGVQVRFNCSGEPHWVGANSIQMINGRSYVEIAPTSSFDSSKGSRKLDSWLPGEDGKMYVDMSEVKGLCFYWKTPED